MSLLNYIILCPLIAAAIIAFVPAKQRVAVHAIALVASFVSMVLSLLVFVQFQAGAPGLQFEQLLGWAPALGIQYHVGVDGLNIGLLVMGSIVGFASACVSWDIKTREKEFYLLLMLMIGGILGAFASFDLFFFYFFHELALVPTFIMIGVWGRGEEKGYAAFQITIYLTVGALLTLVGLILLCINTGIQSFDWQLIARHLATHPLSNGLQQVIFPLFLFGFGILVSLWPFHSWAPLGYAEAPTATAMMHAGVIKKFGLYGLLRIAIPLLPQGAQSWMHVLAWLCLGNIVYAGLAAMRQKNLNYLIGFSSVAHVGFAFLGLASLTVLGITGAVVVMVAHGFLAALSFALSGYLYEKTGTLEMDQFGGLLRRLPFIGTVLIMAMMAGCGLPGFGNFVGEVMVLFGAWTPYTFVTILALCGALIIAAIYMLRAIRKLLHGPLPEKWATLGDAWNPWRKVPFVLLISCLILLGCFPRILVDKIKPSAELTLKMAAQYPDSKP